MTKNTGIERSKKNPIELEEYDIPNPPVPSLLVLNIVMPLFLSVLVATMLLSL